MDTTAGAADPVSRIHHRGGDVVPSGARLAVLVAGILAPLALLGCGGEVEQVRKELAQFRQEAEAWRAHADKQSALFLTASSDWRTTMEKLTAQMTQVAEKLSDNMVRAADSVDPLAIKELYRDGKEIRKGGVAPGGERPAKRSGDGAINLATGDLLLGVESSGGRVHVEAALDQRENRLFDLMLGKGQAAEHLPCALLSKLWEESQAAAARTTPEGKRLDVAKTEFHLRLKDARINLPEEMLSSLLAQPDARWRGSVGGESHAFHIADRMGKGGSHQISLTVTPRDEAWGFRVTLSRVHDERRVERVFSMDVNSDSYGRELGKPINVVLPSLLVKYE